MQGAYTWAHAIDDSNDPLAPAQGNRAFPRNSRDLREERGNSDNDIRHVAVISYIWEAAVGKGKGFLNNGFVGKVFEGMAVLGHHQRCRPDIRLMSSAPPTWNVLA